MIPLAIMLYAHCQDIVSIPALEPYRGLCELVTVNTLDGALLLPDSDGLFLPDGEVLRLP